MTEPLDVAIRTALLRQLDTPAISSPATPIAYPFVAFTPPKDTITGAGLPYLDARALLRAEPETPALSFTGPTFRRGIFQVDAVWPDGQGDAPPLRLAALVAARFAIGTVLTANGFRLHLNNAPNIAAAVKDAPWVRFPVSIRYLVIS